MQMISEVMTRNVQFVSPQESLQRAAQMMGELDVGSLPVCDGERLVGMITDRDITVRATAAGRAPGEAHVDEVMSTDVRWVFEDQPLDEVMVQMADNQIRRVPVVSHDDRHRLVGIVALGDIAIKTPDGAQKEDVEQLVEMVSSPATSAHLPAGAKDVAGRTGEGSGEGSHREGPSGSDLPSMGQGSIGAAGASGDAGAAGGDRTSTGAGVRNSADAGRKTFGPGGQNLTMDGLPPT